MVTPAVLLQTQEPLDAIDLSVDTIISVILILFIAYLLSRVIDYVLKEVADRLLIYRFRVTMLIPLLQIVVYAVAAYIIVEGTVDPTRRQMLAFAGLFGAALGFGFRELVADILGGLAIVVERPYRIGDKVSIGAHYGEILTIGLRSTQLVTLDDDLVRIPNHHYFQETIVNANAGSAEMLVTVDFYASLESDPREVTRIVEEAITTSQYVYLTDDHPVSVLVEDEPYYYVITGKAYVNDLRNESAFKTDVIQRVLRAFREHDIERPTAVPGARLDDGR